PRLPPASTLFPYTTLFRSWGYQDQAVLGLLMGLPVAMTATLDDRRWVWLAIAVALASMFTVSYLGQLEVTETPRDPFGFDRILALVVVGFSAVLAMILQRRRMEAERARDEAVATGNLNRLLVALISHDLRALLVLADQALTYSYENAIRSEPSDPDLLADVSARVGRSLRMIEGILSVARNHVAD